MTQRRPSSFPARNAASVLLLMLCGCACDGTAPAPPAARGQTPETPAVRAPLPPLVVEDEAPLLLDEAPAAGQGAPAAQARPPADNEACFVCHTNYREEPLAAAHATRNVACMDCHGKSNAHRNDENNTTPPDTMYPRDAIDRACAACHDGHDVPARDVIARWLARGAGQEDPAAIVCTDCHGEHRLKLRSVRWDKKTGTLLPAAEPRPR